MSCSSPLLGAEEDTQQVRTGADTLTIGFDNCI
jgi:hypothetical protein